MLEIHGDCAIMLFGAGIYKSRVHLQSVRGGTAQLTVKGEPFAISRAEEARWNVNLS